jgi:hypothetical protein
VCQQLLVGHTPGEQVDTVNDREQRRVVEIR